MLIIIGYVAFATLSVFSLVNMLRQINKIKDSLPKIKAWIEVADGFDSVVENCMHYSSLIEQCSEMERWNRPDDIVYMLYTGGTTGMPKGVMYNQAEFIQGMFKTLRAMGYELPEDLDTIDEYILDLNNKKAFKFERIQSTIII